LSGWLIRNSNELVEELTELYDCKPLSFLSCASLVFAMSKAAVFKIGPAERRCQPLESAILHRSTSQVHKAVHRMSATVKDRLRRCSGTRSAMFAMCKGFIADIMKAATLIFLISLPRASFAGYSSLLMISSGSPMPCCCPPCPHMHIGGWGL